MRRIAWWHTSGGPVWWLFSMPADYRASILLSCPMFATLHVPTLLSTNASGYIVLRLNPRDTLSRMGRHCISKLHQGTVPFFTYLCEPRARLVSLAKTRHYILPSDSMAYFVLQTTINGGNSLSAEGPLKQTMPAPSNAKNSVPLLNV